MLALALSNAWARRVWWLWLLRPLEFVFRTLAALRRALYRLGILPIASVNCPVVVVGNITAGGSGKTPVVVALIDALRARGLRAGVVSRGYGATAGSFPHVVTGDSTVDQCGDEALLVYRRTGAPCVVAPKRVEAARTLLGQFDIDLIISDDGLQHYALARDLEIALVDAASGLGNGFCLPAGPLREPPSRLSAVDFVLYREGLENENSFRYAVRSLVCLQGGRQLPADSKTIGRKIYAVAAIGQPAQFFRTLRDLGFDPIETVFPDHHPFEADDLASLQDLPIIMTEKDAVKCAAFAGENAWYLDIETQLPQSVVEAVVGLAENPAMERRI